MFEVLNASRAGVTTWRKFLWAVLAIAVTAAAINWIQERGKPRPIQAQALVVEPVQTNPPIPKPADVAVGSVGRLSKTRGKTVFGFDVAESVQAAARAAAAKDAVGYRELVTEHGAGLEPGAKVLVIDSSWRGSKRIRMQEGAFTDHAFWVFSEDVTPL